MKRKPAGKTFVLSTYSQNNDLARAEIPGSVRELSPASSGQSIGGTVYSISIQLET